MDPVLANEAKITRGTLNVQPNAPHVRSTSFTDIHMQNTFDTTRNANSSYLFGGTAFGPDLHILSPLFLMLVLMDIDDDFSLLVPELTDQ